MEKIKGMVDKLIKQTLELLTIVRKIRETDYVSDIKNFEYLTGRLEYLSEKYTCVVREFAMKTFVANRYEVMDRACEIQGIEVQKDGNTIIIDLPFLLPRKKGSENKFIGDPLKFKLEEMSADNDFKIKEKAVVCIIHTYDNENKNARCYDYDNLESKKILDIVTLFTLKDDAPEYCDVYQTARMGNCDKTRIMVMPIDEFKREKLSLIF